MIERLQMNNKYNAIEATIHMGRYNIAKKYCKGKTVLDISCAEGYGTKLLQKWGAKKVVGLDISKETIDIARKNFGEKNIEFVNHDAMDLSCFKNCLFDLVVSFETIEHLQDPLNFLKEIKRVAKKNAKFIITCPNDYAYYPDESQFNPYHIKKYTFEDFRKMIETFFDKNKIKYMIGTKIEGFINIFLEGNEKLQYQKDMINNYSQINSLKVNPEHNINNKNCSYFTALINIKNVEESSVIFPTSIFPFKD